ncbi:hypothetical protein [Rhodospirillaceae bacterium SYSU D60014]|uniref:hypothetical protein n=1 Tax=Virgifigura deserti TaxID=2268457 RepID=UPI000E6753D7
MVIVDGLDEIAGKRWGDGVDVVLRRLRKLGCPRTLITCRAAEWEGARNKALLQEIYGEDPVETRFAPFSSEELVALIDSFESDVDARKFVVETERRDLGDMLSNPESLRLLVSSVKGGAWPNTRVELFERATQNATRETNERRKTSGGIDKQRLIDSAGGIFASILLSGLDGVDSVRDDAPRFPSLLSFDGDDLESHQAAINTRLFKSEGGTRLAPSHRMVAEYLGARWLARRLYDQELSVRRITMTVAPDGSVRTDLRGLHAWLGALGPTDFRRQAIDRDPYGVLRYGDPSGFSITEKRRLLRRLRGLAEDDPYFRAAEGWTRPMIAGFLDPAIRDEVMAVLTDRNRNYHLSTLLLAAMRGSKFAETLVSDLLEIGEDENRPYGERSDALEVLDHLPGIGWSGLLERLRRRRTEDAARLSLKIVVDRGSKALTPCLIADVIADAMLINSGDRHAHLSRLDYGFVERLPVLSLEPVLDRLSERMVFMCTGRRRYDCGCIQALSPAVIRLVERRFREGGESPTADQVWQWIRKTHIVQGRGSKSEAASAALKRNDNLRRAIQAHGLRDPDFEENSWMALWRITEKLDGLQLSTADIVHHMNVAADSGPSTESVALWADLARWGAQNDEVQAVAKRHGEALPELAEKWAEITRPHKPSYAELRFKASERKSKREAEAKKRARCQAFNAVRTDIESGSHVGWLIEIAQAYLGHSIEISGETPEDRLSDLLGHNGVSSATSGLRTALRRDDLPTLEQVAQAKSEGKHWSFERVMCAGILAQVRAGERVEEMPLSVLEAARASTFFDDAFEKEGETREALETVIFANKERVERFARRLFEPQLAAGRRHIGALHLLTGDDRFASCAGRLALEWLETVPDADANVRRELMTAAILFGGRTAVTDLVRRQCALLDEAEHRGALEMTDPEARALWIPAVFLLDFETHRSIVQAFAEEARSRLCLFRGITYPDIIHRRREDPLSWPRLGLGQNRFLLETFAAKWPAADPPRSGWVGDMNPWHAHEFLRQRVQEIGASDESSVGEVLDALIGDPTLHHHHDELRHLRAGWLRRQRDAAAEVPDFEAVRAVMAGGAPKSVADLQAMTMDALQWLQEEVRDGDTNGWVPFWNGEVPHGENDCRDRILDRIRPKFEPVEVQLRPECRMPDDKRADIVASLVRNGEIHDLPVEVKGQWHKEVWSAAAAQLDERYTRYVNARGRGIYLVLWFGPIPGKSLRRHADGRPMPQTPRELEQMLCADLSEGLRNRIDVFVLDVSKPKPS